MTFQIKALDPAPFSHLFELDDTALSEIGAKRVIADASPCYPCRVSLEDAKVGDELILLNYQHMGLRSPYQASHAIYVRKGVSPADLPPDTVPDVMKRRLISVRGFDENGYMQEADVVDGEDLAASLQHVFAREDIAFVDIHMAKAGCFAARAERAA